MVPNICRYYAAWHEWTQDPVLSFHIIDYLILYLIYDIGTKYGLLHVFLI